MAVFDNPSHAIQCAAHLRDSTEVFKISLHVGECSVATGTPTDPVFEIADRAAELASPGEIVVTRTLCDILAGSGYVFQPRPSQPTRRLPETIPLFALA
jgi:class 3 adenylate cyclase